VTATALPQPSSSPNRRPALRTSDFRASHALARMPAHQRSRSSARRSDRRGPPISGGRPRCCGRATRSRSACPITARFAVKRLPTTPGCLGLEDFRRRKTHLRIPCASTLSPFARAAPGVAARPVRLQEISHTPAALKLPGNGPADECGVSAFAGESHALARKPRPGCGNAVAEKGIVPGVHEERRHPMRPRTGFALARVQ